MQTNKIQRMRVDCEAEKVFPFSELLDGPLVNYRSKTPKNLRRKMMIQSPLRLLGISVLALPQRSQELVHGHVQESQQALPYQLLRKNKL